MSRYTEPTDEQRLLIDRLGLALPEQPRPRITSHQPDRPPGPMSCRPLTREPGFCWVFRLSKCPVAKARLVSCLTNGWCFAARDFRVQRGVSDEQTRRGL